jgi:hypothetical protein
MEKPGTRGPLPSRNPKAFGLGPTLNRKNEVSAALASEEELPKAKRAMNR